jgi:hypothetical protein
MPAPLQLEEKTIAKIVRLYRDENLPVKALQQRFSLSHQTVEKILTAAGLAIRGRGQSRQRLFL